MSITFEKVTEGLRKIKHLSITFEKVTEVLRKIKHLSITFEKVTEGLQKIKHLSITFEKVTGGLQKIKHVNYFRDSNWRMWCYECQMVTTWLWTKSLLGEQKLKNGKGKCNVGEVKLEKTLEKMKMCICRLMVWKLTLEVYTWWYLRVRHTRDAEKVLTNWLIDTNAFVG